MEKTPHVKAEKVEKTTVTDPAAEPRNFLAAFLLALSLGPLGVNRIYTGESTLGWIRFGLFTGGFVLSPVIIGVPLFLVAIIWGIVDVFLVYLGDRTDAEGRPMVQTARDRRFAKVLYVLFIVSMILVLVGFVLGIVIGIMAGGLHYDANYGPQQNDWRNYNQNY